MNTNDFLRLTDGVDEKYLAETVSKGRTARGKRSLQPDAPERIESVREQPRFRAGFWRPVFAGLLTAIAAGGAAAWFFALPKLRKDPGTSFAGAFPQNASGLLPDLSEFGIDTSEFVLSGKPYQGGMELDFAGARLTEASDIDTQTDNAYQWCYDTPRPSENWAEYDGKDGAVLIFDSKGKLRRFRNADSVMQLDASCFTGGQHMEFKKMDERCKAFVAAIIPENTPKLTPESIGASSQSNPTAYFSGDSYSGHIIMDNGGNIRFWYADYANMEGLTPDTEALDASAKDLFDSLAEGTLSDGSKWQIVNRSYVNLSGRVYGLYVVLMGRRFSADKEIAYGTRYYMIDAELKMSGLPEGAERAESLSLPDLSAFNIATEKMQKCDAPYAFDIRKPDDWGDDMQLLHGYEWFYQNEQPLEKWTEYRYSTWERLVYDSENRIRRFYAGKGLYQPTEDEKQRESELAEEARDRAEQFVRTVAPSMAYVPDTDYSFTDAADYCWELRWDTGSCMGVLTTDYKGFPISFSVDYTENPTVDTEKYDEAAKALFARIAFDKEWVPNERRFVRFCGKVYGLYTVPMLRCRGIDTLSCTEYLVIDPDGKLPETVICKSMPENLPDLKQYDLSKYGLDSELFYPVYCYYSFGSEVKRYYPAMPQMHDLRVLYRGVRDGQAVTVDEFGRIREIAGITMYSETDDGIGEEALRSRAKSLLSLIVPNSGDFREYEANPNEFAFSRKTPADFTDDVSIRLNPDGTLQSFRAEYSDVSWEYDLSAAADQLTQYYKEYEEQTGASLSVQREYFVLAGGCVYGFCDLDVFPDSNGIPRHSTVTICTEGRPAHT